jgi:hypothetical protein
MAILVDQAVWPWRGRRWAHLVSDTSYDELHDFAARLGMPRSAFQGDHYDIPDHLHARAIELGAELVDGRVLARRLRDAGLRIDKRYTGPGAVPEPASAPPERCSPG